MSSSYSYSESISFSVTHAKKLASKVATDLKRMQRFYKKPDDEWIQKFEIEIIEFLKMGYLETVSYGFQRDGNWIEPTLRYTAKDLSGMTSTDDDPGRIRPGADIQGAFFNSYLTYSQAWFNLSPQEKDFFNNSLPFQRTGAPEPGINGILINDKTYSSGGRALERFSIQQSR